MAGVFSNVPAPEAFNFNEPDSWPIWSKRFERYISVGGFAEKTDQEKVNMLLYIMGQDSETILLQFDNKPETLEDTLNAFKSYFAPRENTIFERFKFNSRKQAPGESVDSFISDLHLLAQKCKFGDLKEEMIRDRIVVGMTDIRTSENMQLKSDLTLKLATEMARLAERQHKENQVIRNNDQTVNFMQGNAKTSRGKPFQSSFKSSRTMEIGKQCYFCGKQYHAREVCPAKNAICRSCGIRGHFQISCKSAKSSGGETSFNSHKNKFDNGNSKINNVNVEQCDEQPIKFDSFDAYLSRIICHDSIPSLEWCINCFVEELDKDILFLIDTGACDVYIPDHKVPIHVLKRLDKNCTAYGPDGAQLIVLGKIKLNICYRDISALCLVYVIKNLQFPLLGRKAIQQFKIIDPPISSKINNVSSSVNKSNLRQMFPKLFKEIGEFRDEVSIKLKKDAVPFVQSVPRPVPFPYMTKLKNEIDRLIKLKIIEQISEVTEWVSPIVVVPKGKDEIRLCGDYTKLNEAVMRPNFPIPKIESILANLNNSKYFSKIDCNKGFYQIKLDEESQKLTCFISPYGRYIFKRLPFGISCAPEAFVYKYKKVLEGIPNIVSHMDDLLVYANTEEEHNRILFQVLQRMVDEGITINEEKSIFGVREIKFLGLMLSENGISVDPERIEAIKKFPTPENKSQLQRFLGIINFTNKFIEGRSEMLEPLYSLLKNDVPYAWTEIQNESFKKIKLAICQAPTLAYYDPSKKIIISSDASSYGLGSCLMQEDCKGNREIVSYVSRTLTSTEKHYAQIEREALSLTWAAEKFSEFITGIPVVLETDHKPLVQLLQTKNIDTLTPRLQRFRMRLMRFDYKVTYVPGKTLVIADALSRSPIPHGCDTEELNLDIKAFVNHIVSNIPIEDPYLEKIKDEQSKDRVCSTLKMFTIDGWPARNKIPDFMAPYYQHRNDISFSENLLLYGHRIIIPTNLQKEILECIHSGHQGITKCRRRAQSCVWWIGLSTQIENVVKCCPKCIEESSNHKETFLKEDLPTRPMQKIAVDLYKQEKWFVIITDYFSRFFEIYELKSMTTKEIISKVKDYFSKYGLCNILRSDNGGQFNNEFKQFAREFNFIHETSSPYYSQSNGAIEAAVKTAKRLLKMNKDISLALLNYRSTPLANGFSPAELMMGRKFKTLVPVLPSKLEVVNSASIVNAESKIKEKTMENYNKRHRTKDLDELKEGDTVWIIDLRVYGVVQQKLPQPRSYMIKTSRGTYRRNRWHLVPAPYHNVQSSECGPASMGAEFSQNNDLLTSAYRTVDNNPVDVTETCDSDSSYASVDEISNESQQSSTNVESRTSSEFEQNSNVRTSSRIRKPPIWMADYSEYNSD